MLHELDMQVTGPILVADDQDTNRELLEELESHWAGRPCRCRAPRRRVGGLLKASRLTEVDAYDALTTERPYKKAFSSDEALLTMKEEVAKGWWDRHILCEFEHLIRYGPPNLLAKATGAAS
jgi:hypothetical protein